MTVLKPAGLDLFAIRDHVKAEHKSQVASLPRKREEIARLHARWHAVKGDPSKQMPGLGHAHGGQMASVDYGQGSIFSVHPMGCHTGREVIRK